MTARATLKMTETELTRRHSVRTVTHINTPTYPQHHHTPHHHHHHLSVLVTLSAGLVASTSIGFAPQGALPCLPFSLVFSLMDRCRVHLRCDDGASLRLQRFRDELSVSSLADRGCDDESRSLCCDAWCRLSLAGARFLQGRFQWCAGSLDYGACEDDQKGALVAGSLDYGVAATDFKGVHPDSQVDNFMTERMFSAFIQATATGQMDASPPSHGESPEKKEKGDKKGDR